jgi:uncharacterized protein (TIGR02996 family)
MSLQEAFRRDIAEHPDDDTPRLVYADWLDEQGDPRGEFIRVQVRLTRTAAGDPGGAALARREAELLAAHRDDWLGELPAWARGQATLFQRGFVAALEADVTELARGAAALWAVAPLTRLRLRGVAGRAGVLGDFPHLRFLTALDLSSGRLTDADVSAVAATPCLDRLATLDLSYNEVGPAGAAALAGSPHLPGLRALLLDNNRLGEAGVEALAASERLRLLELSLMANRVGHVGAATLARSALLGGLTSLHLGNNRLGPAGAAALAASPRVQNLAELFLRGNGIGDTGAAALARSPHLGRLVTLNLWDNAITDAGAAALAASPLAGHLRKLTLWDNPLRPEVQRLLRDRFGGRVRL